MPYFLSQPIPGQFPMTWVAKTNVNGFIARQTVEKKRRIKRENGGYDLEIS